MIIQQVGSGRGDTASNAYLRLRATLAELRHMAASGARPTRRLALRAGTLAANPAMSSLLLRCTRPTHMGAARLWLEISEYLDDIDQIVGVLRLAAQCAAIGGNTTFARNCMKQAADAQRQRQARAASH